MRLGQALVPTKQAPAAARASSPVGLPELLGDAPLRLVIVGHNPSETAWARGHYYANPSNWMWRILRDTKLAPPSVRGCDDDRLVPTHAGVGFTDVGTGVPGTDSSKFTSKHFDDWRQPFFDRLARQAQRAKPQGCTCGWCGAPEVIAFAGKRQFTELFCKKSTKGKKRKVQEGEIGPAQEEKAVNEAVRILTACPPAVPVGRQTVLPQGWPFPLDRTECWVLPSTSGAAPMTRAERYAPWQQLAERVLREPWPREHARVLCATHGAKHNDL